MFRVIDLLTGSEHRRFHATNPLFVDSLPMKRIFIALTLPVDVQHLLERQCSGIPRAMWTDGVDMHCTLRFVGEMSDEALMRLEYELSQISFHPFQLTIQGVGTFPPFDPYHPPTVLWAGLDAPPALFTLQREVEAAVQRAGAVAELRPYHPHVTLARLRSSSTSDLQMWLSLRATLTAPPFTITAMHVMESVLHDDGAEYAIISTFTARA